MKIIECTTKDQLIDHYYIRKVVFIDEQYISFEEEFDFVEKERTPFVVYDGAKPVATARLNIQKEYTKIERVCVLKEYRNKNIGLMLMKHLLDICERKYISEVIISAQVQALAFYEKLGFEKFGEQFLDADIPHYKMKKNLC